MNTPYTPIVCSLYDSLEAAAIRKTPVEIRFNGIDKTILIKDLQTKDQAEYLVGFDTQTGEELVVRLDRVDAYIDPNTKNPLATRQCT
jgi:transcriptional antiterminator Rof (Rho-off)